MRNFQKNHGFSYQSPTTTKGCVLASGVNPSSLWCQTPTIFGVLSENLLRDLGFLQGILCLLSLRCSLSVVLMSDTAEKKSVVVSNDQEPALVPEVVPMMSKITEHKLNGLNYLD